MSDKGKVKSKGDEKKVGKVPEGTVAEITEWVGDDPRRAKKALKEENKSDSPRSTLVEALEKLIPAKEEDEEQPEANQDLPEEEPEAAEDEDLGEDEPVEDAEETEPMTPEEATAEYDEDLDDAEDDTTGHENEVGEGEEEDEDKEEVQKDG